jgi:methanethiol S-methyltransferase
MSTQTLPPPASRLETELPTVERSHVMYRWAMVAYGLVAYGWFLATLLYMIGFLANVVVPKSIDAPPGAPSKGAILLNCLLLLVFGIQHSVMARPAFKRWWIRIVPGPVERSTFVLVTNVIFAGLFLGWQPLPEPVWTVSGPAAVVLWGLFAGGLGLAVLSTFLIDHFELFGVRQVLAAARGRSLPPPTFHVSGVYRFVRHPLMLGFLVAFWATPQMTQGRLLFAAVVTLYILLALRLEERDLLRFHGSDYAQYQRQVPMLLPRPGRCWCSAPARTD